MTDRERELVAQLTATPGDLELRRVYADLLIERGDPRGDFIALQLLGKLSRSQRDRMRVLERRHLADWLGPLADLVESHEYESGFLSHLMLRPETAEAWQAFDSHTIAHEVATIRTLTIEARTSLAELAALRAQLAPLLVQGRLPLLERLSITPELSEVVRCRLVELEIRIFYDAEELPPVQIAFDPAPAALRFVIVDQDLLAPYGASLFARVFHDGLPAETTRFTVGSDTHFELSRDERGALSRLAVRLGRYGRDTLISTVAALLDACPDRAFTAVHVDAVLTPHERRRIVRALVRSPGTVLTSD